MAAPVRLSRSLHQQAGSTAPLPLPWAFGSWPHRQNRTLFRVLVQPAHESSWGLRSNSQQPPPPDAGPQALHRCRSEHPRPAACRSHKAAGYHRFPPVGPRCPMRHPQCDQIRGGLVANVIQKAKVPALLQDVFCNAVPHKPDADNSDFCHSTDLFPCTRGQNHGRPQKGTPCSVIGTADGKWCKGTLHTPAKSV